MKCCKSEIKDLNQNAMERENIVDKNNDSYIRNLTTVFILGVHLSLPHSQISRMHIRIFGSGGIDASW